MSPARPAAKAAAHAAEPRDSVSALERGFAVLRCFKPGEPALSHLQIVRGTGLPKATVSRITQTLVKLGYLDVSHADGRFRLTAQTLAVGHAYLANVDVRTVAQPLMAELAEHTQATVNLVVRSGDHLVVVETVRSDAAVVAINSRIGFQFPILQTAIGRAYLAGLAKSERAPAIKSLRATVAAHQWKSLQLNAAKAIADCEAQGFCALWGEWRQGVNSVAVPFRAGRDGELYVVNCAGPASHFDPATLESDVGPRLLRIAQHVQKTTSISWGQT